MSSPIGDPSRLLDPELHATGEAHVVWQWMREHAPVCWHPPGELPGFWSVTRYEDVRAVYRTPGTFSSANGVLLRATKAGEDPGAGLTLALTDPPRHAQLRSLMAKWFTDRSARALENVIEGIVQKLLVPLMAREPCDFAHDVTARLTIYFICEILGIPDSDHEFVYRCTSQAFAANSPLATHVELMQYLISLMEEREIDPGDDLMSALIHGVVEGERLSEAEVLLNCENMLGAAENAGLSMVGGVLAFIEHPEEWGRLRHERALLPSAVEEVLRWTSSATHSMRRVVESTVLQGQRLAVGDRVVLWLPSANRDERAFPNPNRFEVARHPNRHVALGVGPHFCIGNAVARAQMRCLLTALLELEQPLELCGPSTMLRSLAVNGPERLPIRIRRSA